MMLEIAIKYIINISLGTQHLQELAGKTNFLLDEIYLTLEIRMWLNDNFVLLDYMSDLSHKK